MEARKYYAHPDDEESLSKRLAGRKPNQDALLAQCKRDLEFVRTEEETANNLQELVTGGLNTLKKIGPIINELVSAWVDPKKLPLSPENYKEVLEEYRDFESACSGINYQQGTKTYKITRPELIAQIKRVIEITKEIKF